MTAEEYLRQIAKIDALILNKQADYRRWQEIAEGFGSFSDGDRVQGSKNLQKIPDAIGRYIDIEREVERLKQRRLEIIGTMEQLPAEEYDLLFRYYALGHSLKEIAYHMKKGYDRVKVIKREGLNMVQRILDERA
jgi:DNA-directed RNA polymerase specialized sigma24 family protein